MSGSGFPEGLCTLLVNHHAISQPSTASWRLAFSSQRLSGPCYSHCRVACMLRSNGSWGTCIPQGITTFLHYASRRSTAPQSPYRVGQVDLYCHDNAAHCAGPYSGVAPTISSVTGWHLRQGMPGAPFPVGLCTLQVIHHVMPQPNTPSWRLVSSAGCLSGSCCSPRRVVCEA